MFQATFMASNRFTGAIEVASTLVEPPCIVWIDTGRPRSRTRAISPMEDVIVAQVGAAQVDPQVDEAVELSSGAEPLGPDPVDVGEVQRLVRFTLWAPDV